MIFKESNYVNDSIIAYNETNIPVFEKNGKSYIDYDLLEKFSESEDIPLKAAYRRVIRYNKLDEASIAITLGRLEGPITEATSQGMDFVILEDNSGRQYKEIKHGEVYLELKRTYSSFLKARNGSDDKMELAVKGIELSNNILEMARTMDDDSSVKAFFKVFGMGFLLGIPGFVLTQVIDITDKGRLIDAVNCIKNVFVIYTKNEKQPAFSRIKSVNLW